MICGLEYDSQIGVMNGDVEIQQSNLRGETTTRKPAYKPQIEAHRMISDF